MDAVFEHRAVLDQVQPEARRLALAADAPVGQPDRRHQVTMREHRQHPRVDLVGLARQRRQTLDLLRVGDQHLPAQSLERVVHEPRAGHRLDHPAHRQPIAADTARQAPQALGVRRRGELLDHFRMLREQADIEPVATQIQSSVQHEDGPPRARSSVDTRSVSPGRPSFIAFQTSSERARQAVRQDRCFAKKQVSCPALLVVVLGRSTRVRARGARSRLNTGVARCPGCRPFTGTHHRTTLTAHLASPTAQGAGPPRDGVPIPVRLAGRDSGSYRWSAASAGTRRECSGEGRGACTNGWETERPAKYARREPPKARSPLATKRVKGRCDLSRG